jgi:hypothetical protein
MGSGIPMIPFLTFLDHLAPPQPDFDLNATIQSLKLGAEPVLTSSNRWTKFAKAPKDSQCSDDGVSPIPEIFTNVVGAIVSNSDGKLEEDKRTVDLLQNPSRAPLAERDNESRPDGYLVLKNRDKVIKDGEKEDIRWADIALSCEYKWENDDDDIGMDVVRIHQVLDVAR